jgi:hypothetical protein
MRLSSYRRRDEAHADEQRTITRRMQTATRRSEQRAEA